MMETTVSNDDVPANYEYEALASRSSIRRFVRKTKTGIILDLLAKYLRPGMRILDAGCGPGIILEEFQKNYGGKYRLFGTDVRRDMLKIARKNVPSAKFIESDLEVSIRARSGYFDAIYCSHVIEHLREPSICLGEFHRVLKPGGIAIITTPNYHSVWPLVEWMWNNVYVALNSSGESKISWDGLHINRFTKGRLSSLMEACGLDVLEAGTRLQASILLSALSEDLAEKIRKAEVRHGIRSLGMDLYAIGKKPLK